MKISEVPYGWIVTLIIEHANQDNFPASLSPESEAALQFCEITQQTLLKIQDQVFPIVGVRVQDQNLLNELHTQGLPYLLWFLGGQPPNISRQLFLQVHRFASQIRWSSPITIGLTDDIIAEIQKKYLQSKNIEQVQDWLIQQLLMESPWNTKESRLFVSLEEESEKHDNEKILRWYGISIIVEARLENEQIKIVKIFGNRNNETQEQAIILAEGPIQITYWESHKNLDRETKRQWLSLFDSHSYLTLWLKYNSLEQEALWKRARNLGYFTYDSWSIQDGQYHFHLKASDDMADRIQELAWEEDLELEARDEIPDQLLYSGWEKSVFMSSNANELPPFIGRLVVSSLTIHSDKLILEALREDEQDTTLPPSKGYLCYSIFGDQKRLERRAKAELAIRTGRCPMPQLRLLLQGQVIPSAGWRGITPHSPKLASQFPYLNSSQQEAIRVALNTPDIALIQGPPGTGKTTVISAIITRLSELQTQNSPSGMVLCTSFQHEAVTNVADRIEIYGLPAMKIGSRYGDSGENRQRILFWIKEQINQVTNQLALLPIPLEYQQIRNMIQDYILQPEGQNILTLLQHILINHNLISNGIRDKIRELCAKLEYGISSQETLEENIDIAWQAIEELRLTISEFTRDGAVKAGKLLHRLSSFHILTLEEKQLLETASHWVSGEPLHFLPQLAQFSKKLQQRFTNYKNQKKQLIPPQILELLTQILDDMMSHLRCSEYGSFIVLQEYLNELVNNHEAVKHALMEYTAVFAATCQQAAGRQISFLKNDNLVYDSVIVDEAARANPLDLFIPLAQAQKRIILVGDHRQLPQMLEPSLEYDSQLRIPQQLQKQWQESLFERLFMMMKKREQQDGIRRTITLDTQYRMHPILGEFVSKQFYEIHGETKIQCGIAPETVAHHLPQYLYPTTNQEAVAVWLEVPIQQGQEQRGQSKSRRVEAQRIAEKLQQLMTTNPNLSFGVISFYAAQVTELQNELCRLKIMTKQKNNDFEVAPEFRYLNNGSKPIERLRVGTVDAFQGREFDVVILSMTRSNNYSAVSPADLRRKYGHLMLANRLCVAMSRQKRLLMVAGDSEMLKNTVAREVIGPLVAFYELCGGPYGCIE